MMLVVRCQSPQGTVRFLTQIVAGEQTLPGTKSDSDTLFCSSVRVLASQTSKPMKITYKDKYSMLVQSRTLTPYTLLFSDSLP